MPFIPVQLDYPLADSAFRTGWRGPSRCSGAVLYVGDQALDGYKWLQRSLAGGVAAFADRPYARAARSGGYAGRLGER